MANDSTQTAPTAPTSDVFADAFAESQAGRPASADAKGPDVFANAFNDSIAGRPPMAGAASGSQTPDFSLGAAVAGPTTAVGAPMSPEMQGESSGVSDILHGNIRQGAGKIWDAEKPHVIQGSLLEKAMQKLDPHFQGSVTSDQVSAHAAAEAINQPVANVAQFIDKEQHPVAKAFAETAQSFLTPTAVATLYATGGLGLVKSPAALSMASRLISGGFSVAAIASAYKNLEGFKDAYDKNDSSEAAYQLTHAITSGLLAAVSGYYGATGRFPNPFRAKANAAAAATSKIEPAVAAKAAAPDVSQPGIVKQVFQGEKVAQPAAQSALRTGAEAVTGKTAPASIRMALDEPVDTVYASAKGLYRQIDQAAGTDFKALNERLDNTEYQLRQLTETEEDVAKEAALEKARTATMDKIAAAKQQALDNGVDPSVLDKADAQFKQARALQELQTKVFKNPNIVQGNAALGTPETINVDSAVKALQRLQDNTKYGGSRLEQALGKANANGLLNDLYAAQRAGVKAARYQTIARWIVGISAVPAAGAVFGGAEKLLE